MLSLSLKISRSQKPNFLHLFPPSSSRFALLISEGHYSCLVSLINNFQNYNFVPSSHYFDFSIQWHHAMCSHGSHLELKLTELELDMWHPVCHSNFSKCPTRRSFPRKMCKFRLSRNSTKIDVVARFRGTIPTMKSVSSSEN